MKKNVHLKLMNAYLYKKMLNTHRTILFFLCIFLAVPSIAEDAIAQLPELSLSLSNVSRRDILNNIENKTKYVFIFSDDLLNELSEKISINVKKQTMDKILDNVLHSVNLTYKISNKQITIKRNQQEPSKKEKTSLKITGRVTDEKGEPLIGVNIQEVGTNNGVVTDMDGNFSIYNVAGSSSILQFTYIGFLPQRVVVGRQTTMNIRMESDIKGLEEVVVVGYGSQKRRV